MKKLISFTLVLTLLASLFAIYASAADLIFHDEFEGFKPANWFTDAASCRYEYDNDNQLIQVYCGNGYPHLQSKYNLSRDPKKWDKFYAQMDFQIRALDNPDLDDNSETIKIWYRDMFESDISAAVYHLAVDFEHWTAEITKTLENVEYYDGSGLKCKTTVDTVLAGPIDIPEELRPVINEGEKSDWFPMGIRVTEGKLDFYFNGKLLLSAGTDENDEFVQSIGGYKVYMNSVDPTVGTQKSPFITIATGSWLACDNFKVYTPDYDPEAGICGDANEDGKVNITDVTTLLKYLAKWEGVTVNETLSDVNVDGKVTNSDVTMILKYLANWEGIVLGK